MKRIIPALAALLFVISCGPRFVMDTPHGFAHFDREKEVLKFISSDGVRLRASSVENKPFGDVAMWLNAVDLHLKGAGYHRLSDSEVATPENLRGKYVEYLYRYNADNYIYGLTLFAEKKQVYIIETGGVKKNFENRRESILKSIRSFKID